MLAIAPEVWFLIVGLRNVIDNHYGLSHGLSKVVSIEKKHDVRSTFFVRVDVIHSQRDCRVLKEIADGDWEVGLHLINTVNDSRMMSSVDELERLKNLLGIEIHGVTPCGSTIGFKGEVTWKTMDSLGMKYMEGYGKPNFETRTFVFPTHLSLDIRYVREFGEREGYRRFKEELQRMRDQNKVATVLVHPEWFVRSVQGSSMMKIPLTLLGKGLMNKVYDKFLQECKTKVEFMKYIDILRTM
ncbi:MAG: hypothetical protein ACETV1_08450 [Candidatus Bathyarchaeia archaeon]